MRALVVSGLAVALLAVAAGCSDDGTDEAGPTTAPAVISACDATVEPGIEGEELVEGELDVVLTGPVVFVPGDETGDVPGTDVGGHLHTGGDVEPGEPHLHYCLAVTNEGGRPVVVDAIQVLPAEGEQALALFEAESLTEAAGLDGARPVPVDAGADVGFELLVVADQPVEVLRHRVAFTVEWPDGPRDLFEEVRFAGLIDD